MSLAEFVLETDHSFILDKLGQKSIVLLIISLCINTSKRRDQLSR